MLKTADVETFMYYVLVIFIFFCFRTGFRPTKDGRLIRLVRRGMRTGQALFPLGIEPCIPRVRPWKELLATGAQTTWLFYFSNCCSVFFN